MIHRLRLLFAGLLLGSACVHAQPTPGVTRTDIVVGTIQDLSGPLAAYGKQIRQGMQMRVDEANELGGIHGRRLRLLVEDAGYDPRRAVLATQKLIGQEPGIFAMVGQLGTPTTLASMPLLLEKNVVSFLPIAAAREMYEPYHRLKFSSAATYYDQMRIAAARLAKDHNIRKPCIVYQDDEFGLEVLRGAEDGLKIAGLTLAEKTSYKRGATDFSSQVARMRAASCDMVVLGTIIRETVGVVAESRKTGFNPVFVGSSAIYTDLIPRLGGRLMDGVYATMTAHIPYSEGLDRQVTFWAAKYRTQYNEEPTVFSAYGWAAIDALVKALHRTGPNLTTDAFIRTMDSMTFTRDMFGTAELTFRPDKRLGNRFSRLSQIHEGRWRLVSDYVAFSGLKPVQRKDGTWSIASDLLD